jgi:hypothetical protein
MGKGYDKRRGRAVPCVGVAPAGRGCAGASPGPSWCKPFPAVAPAGQTARLRRALRLKSRVLGGLFFLLCEKLRVAKTVNQKTHA